MLKLNPIFKMYATDQSRLGDPKTKMSTVANPLPAVVPGITPANQNLDDDSLADWLEQCARADHTVGYLHTTSACKVVDLSGNPATLYPADPDKKSKIALKKLARKGHLQHLLLQDAPFSAAHTVDPGWTLAQATQNDIVTLVDERLKALGRAGRGTDISPKTAWKVWTDSCGRCMFEGCGANLTGVSLYNASSRIGYLAHIIASDPRGPRGTIADSHRLSDNSNNIMLMCDEHHRLIDCFEPEKYSAAVLYNMRQAHCDMVNVYLSALAFPRVKAVTLHANLANIPTYFHDSELIDAILATGKAMQPRVIHHIRRTQRDDRRTPEFWTQYLHEHQLDIQTLVTSYNNLNTANMEELAVFPLHHIATMVLAGRIIGEARATQVFQYHRDRKTWKWDADAVSQPPGTFYVEGLIADRVAEVLITIELTANIDLESLPVNLKASISDNQIPWVRIKTPNPNGACIGHPDDLTQFMRVARQAINHVQDVMRATRVHLIGVSPASTLFCFGQMLQAGHHPTYTIYDRAGRDSLFGGAFSITGHEVTASAGSQTVTIPIR